MGLSKITCGIPDTHHDCYTSMIGCAFAQSFVGWGGQMLTGSSVYVPKLPCSSMFMCCHQRKCTAALSCRDSARRQKGIIRVCSRSCVLAWQDEIA